MANYLYNGVKLPDIFDVYTPEVQVKNPFAYIGILNDEYYFFYTETAQVANETGFIFNNGNAYKIIDGVWSQFSTVVIFITAIWCNSDLYYSEGDAIDESLRGTIYLHASEPVPVEETNPIFQLNLKSWLIGFVLGLAGKPLPISENPESVMYSYNGVILPKLPEWDIEIYPYAFIVEKDGLYRLYISDKARVANIDGSATVIYDPLSYAYTEDAWTVGGYGVIAANIIWTNHDIYYTDSENAGDMAGKLRMEASEPVPVYGGDSDG